MSRYTSRAERRAARTPAVIERFGRHTEVALDLLEIIDLAWHDCYGEVAPPSDVTADMLLVSGGRLPDLVRAGRLGLADWRDLRVEADELRR